MKIKVIRFVTIVATILAISAYATAALAESGNLYIYTWAGQFSPKLISKFEAQTGINVTVDTYNSNAAVLTKLQAGGSGYDIVTPSQHYVNIMIGQGLLKDVDMYKLKGFDSLDERWAHRWWDPTNEYSFPLFYGVAGFAVNRDIYQGTIDSWSVYFEPPPELQGRIASLGTPDEVVRAAELYLGIPYCSEDPSQMKKVLDLLEAQKPYVAVYSSSNIQNRLASGNVAVHFWWNGDAMRARMGGAPIEFAMPKEGLVGWLDSIVVPKGAENAENAKKFINFLSKPVNATIAYNYYGFSTPLDIIESKAKYTPENAPELFIDVPIKFARTCSPKAHKLVNRVWMELMQ